MYYLFFYKLNITLVVNTKSWIVALVRLVLNFILYFYEKIVFVLCHKGKHYAYYVLKLKFSIILTN